MKVQWDFDYDGKFVSTQGFLFIRGDKNLPKLSVAYKFPTAVSNKIACKIQDDKGGERIEIIEFEDAMKAFIKAGGISRKGKGDHVNVKMPNGQIITIPGSCELKIGLLKAAIKKAGLTEEKFLSLLK